MACASAYVRMNCTTCCLSAKLIVLAGTRLVLPCMRGDRPCRSRLALRFLNLFSEIVCRKRKVFLHTLNPPCQNTVYARWRPSEECLYVVELTVCSPENVKALNWPRIAMSSSALVSSLHWPLKSKKWSMENCSLHGLPLDNTQPQPEET